MSSDARLRTAHDVRHLRRCAGCGGLGDRRVMLSGLPSQAGLHHGRCAVRLLGAGGVLCLPSSERAKLTLSDAGVALMHQLLEADDAGGARRQA